MSGSVRGRSSKVSRRAAPGAGRSERGLYLPDASRDAAERTGCMPEVRHGSRTGRGHGGRDAEPGVGGYVPAVPRQRGAGGSSARHRDGRHVEAAALVRNALGGACAGDAGGALGRLAVFRTRMEVDHQPQPEHVYADRDRHRHSVCVQRGRDARAGDFSGIVSRPRRRSRGLLRSGGGDHGAGPARPGVGAAGARQNVERDSRPSEARSAGRARGA